MQDTVITRTKPIGVPEGICQCGCGMPTLPATGPHRSHGALVKKGELQPFRRGHHTRLRTELRWREDAETGCWTWGKQVLDTGYGISRFWGRAEVAHRAVWKQLRPDITIEALELHHTCGSRACVNPDHMRVVAKDEHASWGGHLKQKGVSEVRALARDTPIADIPVLAERYDVANETIVIAVIGSRAVKARRRPKGKRIQSPAKSNGRFGPLQTISKDPGPIAYGFCHCGCGQKTPLRARNDRATGGIKGEPNLFMTGHAGYLRPTLQWQEDLDTGCWIWRGNYAGGGYGYSTFWGSVREMPAHRAVWRYVHGEWASGELHHVCSNRGCVNPAHLVPMTRKDHIAEDRMHLTPEQRAFASERAKTWPLASIVLLAEELEVSVEVLLNTVVRNGTTYRARSQANLTKELI